MSKSRNRKASQAGAMPPVDDAAQKAAAEQEAADRAAAEQAAANAAAAEKEAADKAEAERVAAEQEAADRAAAEQAAANAAQPAPDQSVEDACVELGLVIEQDGHCPVEILESISGGINLKRGDPHRFEAAEAVRAVRAGIAKPR